MARRLAAEEDRLHDLVDTAARRLRRLERGARLADFADLMRDAACIERRRDALEGFAHVSLLPDWRHDAPDLRQGEAGH